MKIIAASDIHCDSIVLRAIGDAAVRSKADLILLAGDICETWQDSNYCRKIPELAHHAGCPVVLTPGNHDFWNPAEEFPEKHITGSTDVVCLVDETLVYRNVKIHGTPWTLRYGHWNWMRKEKDMQFDIPPDTDILLCHGPPFGYGDDANGLRIGSENLTAAIRNHPSLKFVFFGHNHGDRGKRYTINDTVLYNVACLDDRYQWHGDGFVSVEIEKSSK